MSKQKIELDKIKNLVDVATDPGKSWDERNKAGALAEKKLLFRELIHLGSLTTN